LGGHPKKDGLSHQLKNLELAAYKKRFDIEQMFRDFKSGGYNLEDTNVLIIVLYLWS